MVALCPVSAYDPLTEKEAENWLRSISLEELVKFVIKYDWVEHETPKVTWPKMYAVETKTKIQITSPSKLLISLGHLAYEVDTPVMEFPKSIAKTNPLLFIGACLLSFIAGATAVLLF